MRAQVVDGFCPMGCGRTLAVGGRGRVYCTNPECPDQDAVHELLGDAETQHIVTFQNDGILIRHPLRERVRDELENCTLLYALTVVYPPLATAGRWRVYQDETGRPFGWEQLAEA